MCMHLKSSRRGNNIKQCARAPSLIIDTVLAATGKYTWIFNWFSGSRVALEFRVFFLSVTLACCLWTHIRDSLSNAIYATRGSCRKAWHSDAFDESIRTHVCCFYRPSPNQHTYHICTIHKVRPFARAMLSAVKLIEYNMYMCIHYMRPNTPRSTTSSLYFFLSTIQPVYDIYIYVGMAHRMTSPHHQRITIELWPKSEHTVRWEPRTCMNMQYYIHIQNVHVLRV